MAQPHYKVGLIGLGEISSYFIKGVELHPNTELVAVCRKTLHEGDREKYKNFKIFTKWKELVDYPEVNCIIIATPPSSHAEITAYALSIKKKVIVEKPFSLTLKEAFDCIEVAKKNNTHLYFAYHAAFNPMTLQVKERVTKVVQSGDKITSFKVTFKEDVRNYHGANSWIFDPAVAGGGCLIDSGVNAISVVENVGVGHVKPRQVKLGFNPKYQVEVSAQVEFVSASDPNLKGVLIQDWLHTGTEERSLSVTFSSGKSISFDYTTGIITTVVNGKANEEKIKIRDDGDVHSTPMAYEYINIIKDAVHQFSQKDLIDKLGPGPFKTIMDCYQIHQNQKAKI